MIHSYQHEKDYKRLAECNHIEKDVDLNLEHPVVKEHRKLSHDFFRSLEPKIL